MMEVRNVAAEIIRDLKEFVRALPVNGFTPHDAIIIEGLIQGVDVSHKFLLPPFGHLLERQTDCGVFTPEELKLLHLPYEICLFAFQCRVSGRDEYVALLCYDVTTDSENYIRIYPFMLAARQHGGYSWCPDTHQVVMHKRRADDVIANLVADSHSFGFSEGATGDAFFEGALGVLLYPLLSRPHALVNNEAGYDEDSFNMYNGAVVDTLRIMQCSNVVSEIIPGTGTSKTINDKRIRKGKLPLYEYKQLVVDLHETRHHVTGIGSGVKRRQHMRRGHIRKYQSGLRIWVQACMVGSGELGRIDKEYKLENRRAA